MTVAELIDRIIAAYPGATPEAMRTFKPVFYARFKNFEGDKLEQAAIAVLAEFKPTMRQPFPIPKDFEQHLPSLSRDLPKTHGPALDFKAHTERKARLLEDWRKAQGYRGANGVSKVMQALEFIAEPIAHTMAWTSNPEPLRLTRAQLVLAQHRAVSGERRDRHGPPTRDADAWWEQIDAIQQQWKIGLSREDWTQKNERQAAA